jgi:hypothetical protein
MLAFLICGFGLRGGRVLALIESLKVGDLGVDRSEVLFDDVGQFGDLNRPIVEDSFPLCNCTTVMSVVSPDTEWCSPYVAPASLAFP